MRVFIAIDIDDTIRRDIADVQAELQANVDIKRGDAKWVDPRNIHLTLKFLGEAKDPQVVDICKAAKEVASRHEKFEVECEKVGHFGGKSARVLWVGAGENCPELLELQQDLEERLAETGWPKENRKYSAHLTLCRVRNSHAGAKLARLTENYKDFKLGTVAAEAVTVYQSELTSSGPDYTVLGNYELADRS